MKEENYNFKGSYFETDEIFQGKEDLNSKSEELYIGARVLSEEDLKALLPTYENIFEQISNFREKAYYIKSFREKTHTIKTKNSDSIRKECNNVISILGGRGTGKTSVMLTAKDRIDTKYSEIDIILSLIVPDNMGENSDTLGWIITHLSNLIMNINKEYIDSLFKERKSNNFQKYCIKGHETQLIKQIKDLQKSYYFRKPIYYEIINKDFLGKSEYIIDAKEALEVDQNLIENFQNCIDELLKIKRILNGGYEPLIYLFFDDVDISAKRGMEVLISVMRYLTHPNIVVFLSGDYNVFLEIVTLEFLKSENLLDNNLMEKNFILNTSDSKLLNLDKNNTTALELRKTRSYDFIKKIMPPAFRYEMPLLSDKQKSEFRYSKKGNKNEKDILGENLLNLLILNFKIENSEFFFLQENDEVIYDYFKIFDNTPRGLINVYYYLWEMKEKINKFKKDNKNKKSECIWQITEIKQFLDVIVNSSLVLEKYKTMIYDIVKTWYSKADGNIEYYIDYNYLENLFKESMNLNITNINNEELILYKRINIINDFLKIFILAHFFENILKNVKVINNNYSNNSISKQKNINKELINIHGQQAILTILNSINNKYRLYPNLDNVNQILRFHHNLSSKISDINLARVFTVDSDEDRYIASIYFKELYNLNKKTLANSFNYMYSIDREWIKSNIDKLFKYSKLINENFNSSKQYFNQYTEFINIDVSQNEKIESIWEKFNCCIMDKFDDNKFSNNYFLSYIIEKFEKHDSYKTVNYDYILKKLMNLFLMCIEKEEIQSSIYILTENLKRKTVENQLNNQNLEIVIDQFPNIELNEIIEQMNSVEDRKNELKVYLNDDLNKKIWDSFRNNVTYKSFDEINYSEDSEPEFKFYPKKIMDKYFKLNLGLNDGELYIKNEEGFLPNTKNVLKKYFEELEEYKVLSKYSGYDVKRFLKKKSEIKSELLDIKSKLDDNLNKKDRIFKTINNIKSELENLNVREIKHYNEDDIKDKKVIQSLLLNCINEQICSYDFDISSEDNDKTKGEKIFILFNYVMENELENIRKLSKHDNIELDTVSVTTLAYFKDLRLNPMIDRRINEILENDGHIDFFSYKKLISLIKKEVDIIVNESKIIRNRNLNFMNKEILIEKLNNLTNVNLINYRENSQFNSENDIKRFISLEKIKIMLPCCIILKTILDDLKFEHQQATVTIKSILNDLINDSYFIKLPNYNGFKRYVNSKMNVF